MTAQLSLADARTATLEIVGPRAGAISGDPVESLLVLHRDGLVETGIWEITPGVFPGRKSGIQETFHVLAGAGTITGADGEAVELRPGVVVHQQDGWHGTWDVTKTVRKMYVIVTVP